MPMARALGAKTGRLDMSERQFPGALAARLNGHGREADRTARTEPEQTRLFPTPKPAG